MADESFEAVEAAYLEAVDNLNVAMAVEAGLMDGPAYPVMNVAYWADQVSEYGDSLANDFGGKG